MHAKRFRTVVTAFALAHFAAASQAHAAVRTQRSARNALDRTRLAQCTHRMTSARVPPTEGWEPPNGRPSADVER
jgi:hypothetical protein